MTDLLVSVRNWHEAEIALQANVPFIDLKEPARGSLGALNRNSANSILRQLKSHPVTTSVALGEIHESVFTSEDMASMESDFVKIGLSATAHSRAWQTEWKEMMASTPARSVVVAYADAEHAKSPDLDLLLDFAIRCNSGAFLIDTFSKSNGNLLAYLSLSKIHELVQKGNHSNIKVVLAGSLDTDQISQVLPLRPHVIAVRGAVCDGDRTSSVSLKKCQDLLRLIRA